MAIYSLRFTLQKTTIKNYITHLLKDKGLDCEVRQSGEFIYFKTSQDEEVLTLLGAKLPVSLFMGGFEVSGDFPEDAVTTDTKDDLSICPTCVEELLDKTSQDYLNPLKHCMFCGAVDILEGVTSPKLRLSGFESTDGEAVLKKSVEIFEQTGALSIQTHHGDITVFKAFDAACNYALGLSSGALSRYFWMNEEENRMLGSLEKPVLELETKDVSDAKKSGFNIFKAAVADDAMTYMFLYFLKQQRDTAVCFVKQGQHTDNRLYFTDAVLKTAASRLEAYSNTGLRFITAGSRGVVPLVFSVEEQADKLSLFGGIATQQQGAEVETDSLKNITLKEVESVVMDMEGNYAIEHGTVKTLARDDAFLLFVKNYLHQEDFISCYLSLNSERSSLMLLSQGKPRKILDFASIPFDITVIFNGLEQQSDTAIKLLGNYKEKFQDEYNALLDILNNEEKYVASLRDIFGVFGLLIDPSQTFDPYACLYNNALGYSSEGGLKIDMKLVKINDRYLFDWQKSLMSIISFKLADVSGEMIAYSLFESFCDFINENIIEVKKQSNLENVYLGGCFLSNKIFTKRLLKHSSNIYKPNIPHLPLEGVVQSIGGIYA